MQRYGASSFTYGWQGNEATIMFEKDNRRIRFNLPLPDWTVRSIFAPSVCIDVFNGAPALAAP